MTQLPLTATQAREAFHVLLLRRMVTKLPPDRNAWRLKGGVNLRLFFESVRYSEDIDFDAPLEERERLRSVIRGTLNDIAFLRRLGELGIREVRRGKDEIKKDTETTLRFTANLVMQGGVPHKTKIDISFRDKRRVDPVATDSVNPAIAERYLTANEIPLVVPHYDRVPAIRQKLGALAGRTEVQARDVFDLFALTRAAIHAPDLDFLRRQLADEVLEEAEKRAYDLPYEQYAGKVLEFLEPTDRAAWEPREKWIEQQLAVVELVKRVRTHREPPATPQEVTRATS